MIIDKVVIVSLATTTLCSHVRSRSIAQVPLHLNQQKGIVHSHTQYIVTLKAKSKSSQGQIQSESPFLV
jgi:hypothetical protein